MIDYLYNLHKHMQPHIAQSHHYQMDTSRRSGVISNSRQFNRNQSMERSMKKKISSNSPYINNKLNYEQNQSQHSPHENVQQYQQESSKNPNPVHSPQNKGKKQPLSRLNDLLTRNDLIYKNLQERLKEITKSDHNIDTNINNIRPYSDSHRNQYYGQQEEQKDYTFLLSKQRQSGSSHNQSYYKPIFDDQNNHAIKKLKTENSVKVQQQDKGIEFWRQRNTLISQNTEQRSSYDLKIRKQEGKIIETKLTKIKEINNVSPTKNIEKYDSQSLKVSRMREMEERQFAKILQKQNNNNKQYRQYSAGYKNYQQIDSSQIQSEFHLISGQKSEQKSGQKSDQKQRQKVGKNKVPSNSIYLKDSSSGHKNALTSKYFQSKKLQGLKKATNQQQLSFIPNIVESDIKIHKLSPRAKKSPRMNQQPTVDNQHPYIYVSPPQIPHLPVNEPKPYPYNNHPTKKTVIENHHKDLTFQQDNTLQQQYHQFNTSSHHHIHDSLNPYEASISKQQKQVEKLFRNRQKMQAHQQSQETQLQCLQCIDQVNREKHFHNISNIEQKSANMEGTEQKKMNRVSLMFIPFNKLYSSPIMQLTSNNTIVISRKYKTTMKNINVNNGGRNNGKIINGIKYRYQNKNGGNHLFLEESAIYETFKGLLNENLSIGIVGGTNCLKKKLHIGLIAHAYSNILQIMNKHFNEQKSQTKKKLLHISIEHQEASTNSVPLHHSYSSQLGCEPTLHQIILANVQALLERIFTGMKEKLIREEQNGSSNRIRVTKLQLFRIQFPTPKSQYYEKYDNKQKEGGEHLYTNLCDYKIVSTNKVDEYFIDSIELDYALWCVNPLFKYHDQALAILGAEKSYRSLISTNQIKTHKQNKVSDQEMKISSSFVKGNSKLQRTLNTKNYHGKSPKQNYINTFSQSSHRSRSPIRDITSFSRHTTSSRIHK